MNFTRFRNTNDEQSAFGVRVRERGDRFLNLVLMSRMILLDTLPFGGLGITLRSKHWSSISCISRHSESGKMLREVLEDNAGIERHY
jgi:hypothetical protein